MDALLPGSGPGEGVVGMVHHHHHHHDEKAVLDAYLYVSLDDKTDMQPKDGAGAKTQAQRVRDFLEECAEAADLQDASSPTSSTTLASPQSPASPSRSRTPHLLYGLDDQPPALMLLLLAVQHCFLAVLPCLLVLDCLSSALCLHSEDPARAELLCRLLLVAAVSTCLNNTSYGLGLGLVQGPCVASVAAALLVAAVPVQDVEAEDGDGDNAYDQAYGQAYGQACPSLADQFAMGHEEMKAVWQPRARRVQAALLITSALTALLSAAGLPRLVARFQTPITAAVATFLNALPLVGYTVSAASGNWTGALSGALGALLCGLALRCVSVPVPVCSVRRGALSARLLPAVSLLAVLLPLLVGWAVCAVLTATGLIAPSNRLVTSEWHQDRVLAGEVFAVPWPVPFGWPSLSGVPWDVVASSVVAALVVNITSNLTAFYAAGAAASGGQAPDGRALQRGTLVASGVAFLGALWGAPALVGGGQETPGVIPLTQAGPVTASRLAGVLMLALSFFPALAAGLASIPKPLLAGVGLAVLGAGAGQGLTYLRGIDLKSARSCIVLGASVLTGLCVAGRLGLPALSADARLEHEGVDGDAVDAVAAAVVAASPLAGAALSIVLETLVLLPLVLMVRTKRSLASPVPSPNPV